MKFAVWSKTWKRDKLNGPLNLVEVVAYPLCNDDTTILTNETPLVLTPPFHMDFNGSVSEVFDY